MKGLKLIVVALLIGVTSAFAQETQKKYQKKEVREKKVEMRQERRDKRVMEMDEVVSFSDEQKVEIGKINNEVDDKIVAVKKAYQGKEDKTAMKEEIKMLNDQRKKSVKAVMNDEQRQKWKAHKKAKKSSSAN